MSSHDFVQDAKEYLELLKIQRKELLSSQAVKVNNQEQKKAINKLAEYWFDNFSKKLLPYGIDKDIVFSYDELFKNILRLSSSNNRRSSYEVQFDAILKSFNDNIIIFLQTNNIDIENDTTMYDDEVTALLEKVPNSDENDYLREALGCWANGFLKASTVLFWCAAIDRIHKVVEKIGFDSFNKTSIQMKEQTKGKYKNFNKTFSVSSGNDLQSVFDNDIITVLEAMQMIDTNEKSRLISCFNMRCHAAHPGAAPITKYNVISCFSDIIEIVLANPKFSVE
ncbi:MAG: hypothetical protein FWE11_04690 [Defluviitaleaceae bacterium]|nr:hypothetical protein [Defluviitaleaceae bacterium]